MPESLSRQILAHHLVEGELKPGEPIALRVDQTLLQDANIGPDAGAEYDERVEIDLSALGPLVAKPHNPDNVVGVEDLVGTKVEQVCMGSSVNSGYFDLALPGGVLADRGGQLVHPSIAATATPGSRQILTAIAESAVYRQLVEGGVRMLEPVCGPCVGMGIGHGAAERLELTADLQPQLPGTLWDARGCELNRSRGDRRPLPAIDAQQRLSALRADAARTTPGAVGLSDPRSAYLTR